jgi:hypothetical protein
MLLVFIQPNDIYNIENLEEIGLTITGTTPKRVIEEMMRPIFSRLQCCRCR